MSNQMVCKEVRSFVLVGGLRVCGLYLDPVIHRADVGLDLHNDRAPSLTATVINLFSSFYVKCTNLQHLSRKKLFIQNVNSVIISSSPR